MTLLKFNVRSFMVQTPKFLGTAKHDSLRNFANAEEIKSLPQQSLHDQDSSLLVQKDGQKDARGERDHVTSPLPLRFN